jgi:hypothetical protein
MASKTVTFEQAEQRRQQAVDFLNRIGDVDRADDFAAMSTQEYIDHKGLVVTNPRRNIHMPPSNSPTKADLQDLLDSVEEILDGAYVPEASREDIVSAVADALDALHGSEEEDEENEEDEDLDDNGD